MPAPTTKSDRRPPPRFIPPMKAVAGPLPENEEGWATEIKWDGMRLQLHVTPTPVTPTPVTPGESVGLVAYSASGRVVTSMAPELADLATFVPVSCVLDGELVSFDGERPSFARLQQRIHTTNPPQYLVDDYPVVFLGFDVLSADGADTMGLAYRDRRRLLDQILADGPAWRVPPYGEGNGAALLELARSRGLEGVVVKRLDSPYRPGRRSTDWVKVKVRRQHEFVVGGWVEGKGSLAGRIGSVLVGVYETGSLVFAGAVGSGLTETFRDLLEERFRAAGNPFDTDVGAQAGPVHFVAPTVVVEAEFSLWPEGGTLWHPVFRGIRTDRDPADVRRELID